MVHRGWDSYRNKPLGYCPDLPEHHTSENLLGVIVVRTSLTIVVVDGPRPRKLVQKAVRVAQCERIPFTSPYALQLGAQCLAGSSGASARTIGAKHNPMKSREKCIFEPR